MSESNEMIHHPQHYGGDTEHEVIKCLHAWGLEKDALLWNTVKYIARAGKKENVLTDLKKAAWYLNRRIEGLAEPQSILCDNHNPNGPKVVCVLLRGHEGSHKAPNGREEVWWDNHRCASYYIVSPGSPYLWCSKDLGHDGPHEAPRLGSGDYPMLYTWVTGNEGIKE